MFKNPKLLLTTKKSIYKRKTQNTNKQKDGPNTKLTRAQPNTWVPKIGKKTKTKAENPAAITSSNTTHPDLHKSTLTTEYWLADLIIQSQYALWAQPQSKDNQQLKEINWLSRTISPWNTMSKTARHGRWQREGGGVGKHQNSTHHLQDMVEDRNSNKGGKGMSTR